MTVSIEEAFALLRQLTGAGLIIAVLVWLLRESTRPPRS